MTSMSETDEQLTSTNILSSKESRQMITEYWLILIIFNEQKKQENVALSVTRLSESTTISDAFMTNVSERTINEKLENKIYQHTDIRGKSEQLLYLIKYMIEAFDYLWTSFVVVQTSQK